MQLTREELRAFAAHLRAGDRSAGTVEKYLRDVRGFAAWMGDREVTRENALDWRGGLVERGYAPATVNSMLSAVNSFLKFSGREDCRIRFLRLQRKAFRESDRELTRNDYQRLLDAAQDSGRERLRLLMETICSAGIRVSEVRYITLEAARRGKAEIALKGKIRTILLPARLCRKLVKYARRQSIAAGEIFVTRSGKSLSRRQIWREMKTLCQRAGVEPTKVFPHNLRHLFAVMFYRACRDIVKLADVLGHSSINTTRIYLVTTGAEHARQLERLGLVT